TLMVSEVKAKQHYGRNAAPVGGGAMPAASLSAVIAKISSSFSWCRPNGHTEWPDGRVHHEGITTAAPPNSRIPIAGASDQCTAGVDIDYTSQQEATSTTDATYAIITARSYHPGIVNATMVDGSVQTISETVDINVWRAMGTRAGGESAGVP